MRWLTLLGLVLTTPAALAQDRFERELLLGVEAFYAGRSAEAIPRVRSWDLHARPTETACSREACWRASMAEPTRTRTAGSGSTS